MDTVRTGTIEDVREYDRELSGSEIAAIAGVRTSRPVWLGAEWGRVKEIEQKNKDNSNVTK